MFVKVIGNEFANKRLDDHIWRYFFLFLLWFNVPVNNFSVMLRRIFGGNDLWIYVPVNFFSVMSGRSHRFLDITSTFRGVKVSFLKGTTRGW